MLLAVVEACWEHLPMWYPHLLLHLPRMWDLSVALPMLLPLRALPVDKTQIIRLRD